MKNSRNLGRWEKQARQFFGDDFWDDILSVLPDAEAGMQGQGQAPQGQRQGEELRSYERQEGTSARGAGAAPPPRQPAIDVYRTERQVIVHVELPGLQDVSGVDVYMQQDQLVIQGTLPRRVSKGETVIAERFAGEFRRMIPLEDAIVEEKIQATYRHGLLEIILPRRRKKSGPKKRIRIQSDP